MPIFAAYLTTKQSNRILSEIDFDWIAYTVHAMTLFSTGIIPEYFVMEIDKFKIFSPAPAA